MVITHAHIFPVVGDELLDGYIRFDDKIQDVGPMDKFIGHPGEHQIDAKGMWLLPGFVDIHTHLGLYEDGLGYDGQDCNEEGDPITPHLNVIDGINPLDRTFGEALSAGVTTVAVSPGSANPIGGQIAAIHTHGIRIDDMVIKAPVAIKFALGENPKTLYRDRDETPVTRMATAAMIRQALHEAIDYGKKKEKAQQEPEAEFPDFDVKHEALLPLLRGEIQAHFHAHRLDDIFTAIRIAKEFSLDYVIVHGTEGYLAADILAAEQVRVITGPIMTDRSKPELRNMTVLSFSVLHNADVLFSICTDHPETPLQYLPICAAMAQKSGLTLQQAIATITLNPAIIVGLDHEIGSLEPGKLADLVHFENDPLCVTAQCKVEYIQGRKCV